MIKYSVIIPVYNTGNYISECLESLIREKRTDVEIILVNDGSTDDSLQRCVMYSEKIEYIKVIEQNNQGVSVARNNGLKNAKGKWIVFVDSDDFVYEGFFDAIDKAIEYNKASKAFIFAGEKVDKLQTFDISENRLNLARMLLSGSCDNNILGKVKYLRAPWGKVYNRDYLIENNIEFSKSLVMGEDLIFNFQYLINQSVMVLIPGCLYYYRPNLESASKKYNPKIPQRDAIFQRELLKTVKLYELKNSLNIELQNVVLNGLLLSCTSCFFKYNLSDYKNYRRDIARFLEEPVYKEALCYIPKNCKFSLDKKIILALIKYRFWGVAYIISNAKDLLKKGRRQNESRNCYINECKLWK